ncbi:hypothetical protein [Meiothermus sp. CFH 77666]|uniref:hypothetical protein n=1 Tax=Meiothermus sp. CFH 77666 TaxID=2817942 RepID=UPI001AA073FD|nr:hypothetical protein [Meiothermus sp. CFH 77666]MBO1436085.1 hypothetical protein [Meiothermus sp. CFH 77666]
MRDRAKREMAQMVAEAAAGLHAALQNFYALRGAWLLAQALQQAARRIPGVVFTDRGNKLAQKGAKMLDALGPKRALRAFWELLMAVLLAVIPEAENDLEPNLRPADLPPMPPIPPPLTPHKQTIFVNAPNA